MKLTQLQEASYATNYYAVAWTNEYNNTGFEPGELALQDVDFQCRTVTIVATNDNDVQPASN